MRRDSRPYIRQIDFIFYHEMAIRQAVAEARAERVTPEMRNGSGLPDPTAAEAIKNLTPVQSVLIGGAGKFELSTEIIQPERWLEVIDKTYAWCKKQGREQKSSHYELARRRYLGESYIKICMELCLSQAAYFNLVEKIRMYAALQAAQLNLIRVE